MIMVSSRKKYEIYKPKKRYGQNYLVDDNIARKIIKSLGARQDDALLEIGPGQGALTKFLVNEYPEYTAVEIDESSVNELKRKFGENLGIVCGDVMKFDFMELSGKKGKRIKVLGNIPYNITSDILFKLLDNIAYIETAVLMVQKEVAERLSAAVGTKQYGILAVQFGAFAEVINIFNVPPTAFFPKPRVISSVIKLAFDENKFAISNVPLFRSLVRNAFSKRRKTLKNSLKDFFGANDINNCDFNVDFSRRAETLSVNEFVVLSNEINSCLRYK